MEQIHSCNGILINSIKQNFKFGNNIATAIVKQKPILDYSWKPPLKRVKRLVQKQEKLKTRSNSMLITIISESINRFTTTALSRHMLYFGIDALKK
jgi:hypothetical protein